MAEPEAIPVTEAMIDAALHAHATGGPWESPFDQGGSFAAIYRAMAAAAPKPTPVPADVASEAVEWIERQLRSGLLTEAPKDDAKVRALLARDKARGEEIERLRGEAVTASICIDKLARERDAQALRVKALEDGIKDARALLSYRANKGQSKAVREGNANAAWHILGALTDSTALLGSTEGRDDG